MRHAWQRRRARGSFCIVTGGIICLLALAMTFTMTGRSSAEVTRIEQSRGQASTKSAKRPNSQPGTEPPGSVASPTGSTYSVHHRVGGSPQQACTDIGLPNDPADYVVFFDGLADTLRQDVNGTAATVVESDTPQPDGSRLIVITTSAPQGTDLFPGNILVGTTVLTDACFAIGLADPLNWQGLDTVVQADISFLTDGVIQTSMNVTADFDPPPWDGVVEVVLANGAGQGYNGVRLQIKTSKNFTPPNDFCDNRIEILAGTQQFTTIGATKDGNEDFAVCEFGGFADIEADIWYKYFPLCTGDLVVNLCDSAYDTKVAVYGGCGVCPPVSPIACNDDWCGRQSALGPELGQARVPVVQGSCYTIRVGGIQGLMGSGNGVISIECRDVSDITAACCLAGDCTDKRQTECDAGQGTWFAAQSCDTSFTCPIPPPSNDECLAAIPLDTGVPFNGTTVASTGTDISSCGAISFPDSNDVWHSWTATCSGLPTFETCGSAIDFDTTLSIFDGCAGNELSCNDDTCGFDSQIENVIVTEGETYYVRVSGFDGTVGSYRLLVTECQNACCADTGCQLATPALCTAGGGVPAIGQVCGDFNQDGVDDACAGCPPGPGIRNSSPFSGTVDARRPYAQATPLAREGIGTPADPIQLFLLPSTDGLEDCFSLTETGPDPDLGANDVASVVRLANGLYELELLHAIAAGETTTIAYTGDGNSICVLSHPGNVNTDNVADFFDVLSLMDCCLEGPCVPALTERSCDIDRSGNQTPLDILTTIDLLLGSDPWLHWGGTPRPSTAGCP